MVDVSMAKMQPRRDWRSSGFSVIVIDCARVGKRRKIGDEDGNDTE